MIRRRNRTGETFKFLDNITVALHFMHEDMLQLNGSAIQPEWIKQFSPPTERKLLENYKQSRVLTKTVPGSRHKLCDERLKILGLPILEKKRERRDLDAVYSVMAIKTIDKYKILERQKILM